MSIAVLQDAFRKFPQQDKRDFLDWAAEDLESEEGEGPDGSNLPAGLKTLLEDRLTASMDPEAKKFTWEEVRKLCDEALES
jgi:hypothetical protein